MQQSSEFTATTNEVVVVIDDGFNADSENQFAAIVAHSETKPFVGPEFAI
jgi:hypothetical protein